MYNATLMTDISRGEMIDNHVTVLLERKGTDITFLDTRVKAIEIPFRAGTMYQYMIESMV